MSFDPSNTNNALAYQAERIQSISPFHAMALLARAKELESQGRDIIHLELGEPDFPTPEPINQAGIQALTEHKTKYTPAAGLLPLRERIAEYYQQQFNVQVSPQQILVTPGASGALLLICALILNPGDELLLTDPGYPCNRNFAEFFAAKPVNLAVDPANNFQPNVSQIRQAWNSASKALLITSPANPTGTQIQPQVLADICNYVQQQQGVLLVDEIYQGLSYEDPQHCALNHSNELFVINSFSKYFGMTGWRLGWLVAPPSAVPALEKLAQNVFLAAPTPAQYAALAAFEPDTLNILNSRRDSLKQRRDYLYQALIELGIKIPCAPQGAFYIYADLSDLTDDSYDFCQKLLEQQGVAITPGLDFGEYQANQYARFAYTADIPKLQQAVDRLSKFIKSFG